MAATTFSELWTELKADAEAAVSAAKANLVSLEQNIVPVIESDLVLVFNQLKGLAIQAVISAAASSLSGNEKFGTVVTTVFQTAEAQALNIGIQDAQLLAQQAYLAVASAVGKTN